MLPKELDAVRARRLSLEESLYTTSVRLTAEGSVADAVRGVEFVHACYISAPMRWVSFDFVDAGQAEEELWRRLVESGAATSEHRLFTLETRSVHGALVRAVIVAQEVRLLPGRGATAPLDVPSLS